MTPSREAAAINASLQKLRRDLGTSREKQAIAAHAATVRRVLKKAGR